MFVIEVDTPYDEPTQYLLLDDCVVSGEKMGSNWSLHHRDVTVFFSLKEAKGYVSEIRSLYPEEMNPIIRCIKEM